MPTDVDVCAKILPKFVFSWKKLFIIRCLFENQFEKLWDQKNKLKEFKNGDRLPWLFR
jgi:hypothetical protein